MQNVGKAVLVILAVPFFAVFALLLLLNGDNRASGAADSSASSSYEVGVAPGPWGGYSNGEIPRDRLTPIPWASNYLLRTDAVDSLIALNTAFQSTFGKQLAIADAYRDLAGQVKQKNAWCLVGRCSNAAEPGTSNHGWALAVDLGSGINSFNTPEYAWMLQNGPTYGWNRGTGYAAGEAWHWEFWGWANSTRTSNNTPPKEYARQRVAIIWNTEDLDTQFGCLDQLWTGESSWNPQATNPTSGAFGIPQSLPGNKMAEAGADWQTNPNTQINWGLTYIKNRYTTPCGALNFWNSKNPHWY